MDDTTRESMCGRKRRYSKAKAKGEARRWRQRAYCCPACYGWHLTKVERHR